MLSVKDRKWAPFYLKDIFQTVSGGEKNLSKLPDGEFPLVSARNINNGLRRYVDEKSISKIFPGDLGLTVNKNGDGGVGIAYYQPFNFALDGTNAVFIKPHEKLNNKSLLFLSRTITKQRAVFGYGHPLSIRRLNVLRIMLPVDNNGDPDYGFMSDYIGERLTQKSQQKADFIANALPAKPVVDVPKLQDKEWRAFSFDDLFEMHTSFYGKKPISNVNGDIPFVGASDSNNGVTTYLTQQIIDETPKTSSSNNVELEKKLDQGPAICVTNNGSIGHAYYYDGVFTGSTDVTVLTLKQHELDSNLAMFLITVIELQGKLFHYARKWKVERMKKSQLMLPVTNVGSIDWQYMNDYIENKKQIIRNTMNN